MKKQQFILYVNDLYSVKEFYQDVFDFNIKEMMHSLNDVSHVKLIKDGVELQLLQSNYTKDPTSKAKKTVSIKPVFIVNEGMARYRNTSISSGGSFNCEDKEWNDDGYTVCDGRDTEGNVFQVRTFIKWGNKEMVNFEQMLESEILAIANPIMDNLMDASRDIDRERHVKDFTDRMKRIVTQSYLEKVCGDYQKEKGFFDKREFVALFKRPDSVAIIWKQTFTKAKGDFVAEMVLVYQDKKYLVDHVLVF